VNIYAVLLCGEKVQASMLLSALSFKPSGKEESKPIYGAVPDTVGDCNITDYPNHLLQLQAEYNCGSCKTGKLVRYPNDLPLVVLGKCESNKMKTFANKESCDKYTAKNKFSLEKNFVLINQDPCTYPQTPICSPIAVPLPQPTVTEYPFDTMADQLFNTNCPSLWLDQDRRYREIATLLIEQTTEENPAECAKRRKREIDEEYDQLVQAVWGTNTEYNATK
jgi:hypothetical protein